MSRAPAAPSPEETAEPVETEAKLHASRPAFDQLARLDEIDGWRVVERRDVALRDTYWDTPDGRLPPSRATLRVREQTADGRATAELTLKRPAAGRAAPQVSAAQSRTELSTPVAAGDGPAQWKRLPAARPVLDALASLGIPDTAALRPAVVLRNPRHELTLRRGANEVSLTLDEVSIEGQPYRRRYVEVELKRGAEEALAALVDAVARRFQLRPSRQGKVQAARAWLARPRAREAGDRQPKI